MDPESRVNRFQRVNQARRAFGYVRDTIGPFVATAAGAYLHGHRGIPRRTPDPTRRVRRRTTLPPSPSRSSSRMPRRSMYRRRRYRGRGRYGRRKPRGSMVSTEQRDTSMRYVKSRMPRYKRRQWKSFTSKFTAALLRTQPLQSAVYNDYQLVKSATIATPGTAVNHLPAIFSCALYCINAAAVTDATPTYRYSETADGELRDIFFSAYGTLANLDSQKLMFRTAVMDITIANTGSAASDMVLLDCYKVLNKYDNNSNTLIRTDFISNLNEQDTTGLSQAWPNLAITPFQNPNFCRRWKILSKRTIVIQPNDTVQLQLRDPKNRWISGKIMNVTTGYYPRVGYGYLFIARGSPNALLPTNPLSGSSRAVTLQVTVNKTYQYYKPPSPTQRDTITD